MAVSKFMKREDTLMAKTKIQLSKLYNCLNSRKSIYFLVYSVIFVVVAIGVFSFYFFAGNTGDFPQKEKFFSKKADFSKK